MQQTNLRTGYSRRCLPPNFPVLSRFLAASFADVRTKLCVPHS